MRETWVQSLGREDLLEKEMALQYSQASLVAQLVKNPPAMQETPVQSLSREDPLYPGKWGPWPRGSSRQANVIWLVGLCVVSTAGFKKSCPGAA